MLINTEDRGVITKGKYYVDDDGDLLYVFGYGTFEETGGMTHPDGSDMSSEEVFEKCINALGINVRQMISLQPQNYHRAVKFITVWKDSHRIVNPNGKRWNPYEPSESLRLRFERASHGYDIIKKYINHMIESYYDKHEKVSAREVYKEDTRNSDDN